MNNNTSEETLRRFGDKRRHTITVTGEIRKRETEANEREHQFDDEFHDQVL